MRDKDRDYERDRDNDEGADLELDCVGDPPVLTLRFIYVIIQFLVTVKY